MPPEAGGPERLGEVLVGIAIAVAVVVGAMLAVLIFAIVEAVRLG